MLTEFGKIFVFIVLSGIFVAIALFASMLIRPKRPTHEKKLTYECGENPKGSPWVKFNIRFYVVALIFLIFDVEIVLLFPWALKYKEYGMLGFAIGALFLVILFLGMAYEWRKGDLEWARPKLELPTLEKIKKNNTSITERVVHKEQ